MFKCILLYQPMFSVGFQNCQLDYSSFVQPKMKKTNFVDCSIKDVDFSEADLSMAIFKNRDLLSTSSCAQTLRKLIFGVDWNYSFDPELNKIRKAKFSTEGIYGFLMKYDIEIE